MAIKLKKPEDSEPQVYGNENFGIPKDCSKKQRFSTLKLTFYILAVAAICVTGYKYYHKTVDRYLPEITYDKTKQPMIYSTASGFVVQTQSGEKYKVAVSPDGEDSTSMIRPSAQGKSIFFLGESGQESGGFNLCMYNVDADSITVIDRDVTEFKVNSDGKFAIYKKGNTLYFSDLGESSKIADDVSDYFLSENNQVITYFSADGTSMYTCGTASIDIPILVDRNITKIVSEKWDYENTYYIKDSMLYSKVYGEDKKLIGKDIIDATMLGSSVYYTKKEVYVRPMSDFLSDDTYEDDKNLVVPQGADFIKEVDGMSFFDEEAFNLANARYEQKIRRDEIRLSFQNTPIISNGYSLYKYSQEVELVDTHIATPYLAHNSCKDIIVYKKKDIESPKTKDLTDFETFEEAKDFAKEMQNVIQDEDMYLVKEGETPFFIFEFFPTMQIEISLDGKYLYCIESKKGKNEGILTRYEIGANSLINRKEISDKVTDFAVDGSDSSAVMVFSGNTLSFYYNDALTYLSDSSCHEFFFVDRTLFYYDDYDYDKKAGTLCSIRNGVITPIDTEVYSFNVRKHNAVSYIKNYDAERKTGTLYIKNGSKTTRQDTHVGVIIN